MGKGRGKYERTAETRAKIAAANRKRGPWSEAVKQKISKTKWKRRQEGLKRLTGDDNFVKPGGKCKHGKWGQCCYTCDPEGTRKRQTRCIKRSYGLEKYEYLEMFEKQDHKCPGCRQHIEPYTRTAHVDHDHVTGAVRGILCNKCNSALGMVNDDPVVLMMLSEYLHAHVCVAAGAESVEVVGSCCARV